MGSQTWPEFLRAANPDGEPLLAGYFLECRSGEPWTPHPDDRVAAAKLHVEIASRITSQRLGYLNGVEQSALESVYALFPKTREICHQHPEARHFEAIAWHVLNVHVRPFTAKWHRASQAGFLTAVDATDEFRTELATLQLLLRSFDDLLLYIRDGKAPPRCGAQHLGEISVMAEMAVPLRRGIPEEGGGMKRDDARKVNDAETVAINARRSHYNIEPSAEDSVGLALSGGGIRSATFSLGVLIALAERGLLPQFDYLSTVSGGGYLGSFLSAFVNSERGEDVGLGPNQLPFRRTGGEAAALRHLRHHSRYLATGSRWEQATMLSAQLYGMVLNGLAVVLLAVTAATGEWLIRHWSLLDGVLEPLILIVSGLLVVGAVAALTVQRIGRESWRWADGMVALPTGLFAALLCWKGLQHVHMWIAQTNADGTWLWWLVVAGAGLLGASAALGMRPLPEYARPVIVAFSVVAAPLFLFGIYLGAYAWTAGPGIRLLGASEVSRQMIQMGAVLLGWLFYHLLLDVNVTSPHRHYRGRLARAYLIQPANEHDLSQFTSAVRVPLSTLGAAHTRAPYHLVNCALNVPGSRNAAMQGRLTDFFLFSPKYCGSPLIGYEPTAAWEAADRHLDLGTAMAISGAAAAPQMGLGTRARLRFWLALLNVRLGYWVRRPGGKGRSVRGMPGLQYLLLEMMGSMDEKRPWLHVSDGGHIENLGVYELLRRRCKYIVAVDGEQDPQMTFQGLTRLQRLAAIDLGVTIDVDLDDLRLDGRGLSRSHFRFCRIHYPSNGRGSAIEYGYLLYLKLSLTGNEGEFIRRYRQDEPAFPHHSTADQFFSEEQFEAYRSLGEHAGNNLFLRALVGDVANHDSVMVGAWFSALGENLLEPIRGVVPPTHAG